MIPGSGCRIEALRLKTEAVLTLEKIPELIRNIGAPFAANRLDLIGRALEIIAECTPVQDVYVAGTDGSGCAGFH